MLALETSSDRCCVAVRSNGRQYLDDCDANRSHKELLLPMIQALCSAAAIDLRQLQGIGCGAGPGSFTGVRIGVAAAQALALAADCPVVMLNSLDLLARVALGAAAGQTLPEAGGLICARRSRAQAYYLAVYAPQALPGVALPQRSPVTLCDSESAFLAWLQAHVDTGPGSMQFCGERPPWLPHDLVADLSPVPVTLTAAAAMTQTLTGMAANLAVPAEAALPIYLPEDSPWQPTAVRK